MYPVLARLVRARLWFTVRCVGMYGESHTMPQITFTEFAVLLVVLLQTAFWVWMLVEALSRETDSRHRVLWSIVIVLGQGLGALVYFAARWLWTGKRARRDAAQAGKR